MVKKVITLAIDPKILEEIEKLRNEDNYNNFKSKKKKSYSRSEYIENLIKLGIRAKKEGFLFI